MSILKYTMIKYLKSWSTWVILIISILIAFIGGGYLPYNFLAVNKYNSGTRYASLIMAVVAGITSFLSIFVSIFAGFKSAQMFKDEVEDGTFLVILSKPLTRSKIIFWKWTSLQILMIGFTFITSLAFAISTAIFDVGDQIESLSSLGIQTISSKIPLVSLVLWAILTLFGLIFTSIALLISTRLSTGTTIGISIAIGVIIPITNIISLFTHKTEWDDLSTDNLNNKTILLDSISKNINKVDNNQNPLLKSIIKNQINDFRKKLIDLKNKNKVIGSIAFKNGSNDGFKSAWPFDLNFHVNQISSFASDLVIPNTVKNIIYSSGGSWRSKSSPRWGRYVEQKKLKNVKNENSSNKLLFNLVKKLNENTRSLKNSIWTLTQRTLDIIKTLNLAETEFTVSGSYLEKLQGYFGINIDKLMKKQGTDSAPAITQSVEQTKSSKSYLLKRFHVNKYGIAKIMKGVKKFFEDVSNIDDSKKIKNKINYTTAWKKDHNKKNDYVLKKINVNSLTKFKEVKDDFSKFWDLGNYEKNKFTWNDKKGGMDYIDVLSDFSWNIIYALNNNKVDEKAKYLKFIYGILRDFFNPLRSYFLNEKRVQAVIDDEKLKEVPKNIQVQINQLGLGANDQKVYKWLSMLYDKRQDDLSIVKRKEYVNKNSLLYFYLSLALFLVPLSYWLTRKQDYR